MITTHTFSPDDVMDWHITGVMREHNEFLNQKPTVLNQLQKFLFSLCSRLGLYLTYKAEIGDQDMHQVYRVSDRITVDFRAYGPLSQRRSTPITSPKTLQQFQAFLDQLNAQIGAPHNTVITDLLRCLTVVNEKDFLIDCYTDTTESFLEIRSTQLRQSIVFLITHD